MEEKLEGQLVKLIAMDRIDRPISSMSGKMKRRKPKLAKEIDTGKWKQYDGERVKARINEKDCQQARGVKEGIEKFEQKFPKYGRILRGYIEEQRTIRERYLVFEMRHGCRITSEDYMGVMTDLGFTPATADRLYPELMDISRRLAKKREESERAILINQGI